MTGIAGEIIAAIVGVVLTAGLGAIAWFFRQWARGLSDKVDNRADDLKAQINETAGTVEVLGVKVDDTRESLAEVRGAVGLAQRPSTWRQEATVRLKAQGATATLSRQRTLTEDGDS